MNDKRVTDSKHVTEQEWLPELREDGVYLVAAEDRTTILKLCRPDRDSDHLLAGYLIGLQALHLQREKARKFDEAYDAFDAADRRERKS